jgi:hypothetical protein
LLAHDKAGSRVSPSSLQTEDVDVFLKLPVYGLVIAAGAKQVTGLRAGNREAGGGRY